MRVGTALERRERNVFTSVAVRESSTAVEPVTRTTTRPVAAGAVTTRASTTPGTVVAIRATVGGVRGGRGDERGCGGAGTERGDEHVVAVAAGVALVDDRRAGHAEVHAERGDDEGADHDETDRQHRCRAGAVRRRSSVATATRR